MSLKKFKWAKNFRHWLWVMLPENVLLGESFETDDGLPSFEDCLVTNTGGGTSTVRIDLICISVHQ